MEFAQDYLDAALSGERRRVFALVDRLREGGHGINDLYLKVFQPALRELGCLWEENKISVGQEHLVTALTQAAMARVYAEDFCGGDSGRTIVAGCTHSERHEVGLRMVCDLLEYAGWEAHYLGAAVPQESLVEMVRERQPDVVAVSASIVPHVPHVQEVVRAVRAIGGVPPLIVVGGRPFNDHPRLVERVDADLSASDAAELVTVLTERFPPRSS